MIVQPIIVGTTIVKYNKLYYSLAFLFYILCASVYVYDHYQTSKRVLYANIDAKLLSSAKRIPIILPDGMHHQKMSFQSVSRSEDETNIRQLSLHAELSEVEYLYSCIKHNDKILFTSSSASPEELQKKKNITHYFDPYSEASVALKNIFKTPKIVFEESTDQWGSFRSVLIPMKSEDGTLYVIGADVRIDFLNDALDAILKESIFELLFYLLLLLPLFGLYSYQSRHIQSMLISEVRERTKQVKNLLDNANQGFLSFGPDLRIFSEYSEKCLEIFDQMIEGRNIAELLYPDNEKQQQILQENVTALIGDTDTLRVENILALMHQELQIGKKTVEVEYKMIDDAIFMMIVTDVTEKKVFERKLENEKNKLKLIVSAVENTTEFFEILDEYRAFIEHRTDLVQQEKTALENLSEIYRIVHTFKGLLAQIDFITTPRGLHKLESKLAAFLADEKTTNDQIVTILKKAELENWLDRDLSVLTQVLGEDFINRKNEITLRLEEIDAYERTMKQILEGVGLSDALIASLLNAFERLKQKPLMEMLSGYPKFVHKLGNDLGKLIYPLHIHCDAKILVGEEYRPFVRSLVHLFRNCVNHGIESPEERVLNGKDPLGMLRCDVEVLSNGICIVIEDDGAGINTKKVGEKAIRMGLISAENLAMMSQKAINRLIFSDNFSTQETITHISGRGIGLAVVKAELTKLQGTMTLNTQASKGTMFTFFIPFSKDK